MKHKKIPRSNSRSIKTLSCSLLFCFFYCLPLYSFDCGVWLVENPNIRSKLSGDARTTAPWIMALRLKEIAEKLQVVSSINKLKKTERDEYNDLFNTLSFRDAKTVMKQVIDEVLLSTAKPPTGPFKELLKKTIDALNGVEVNKEEELQSAVNRYVSKLEDIDTDSQAELLMSLALIASDFMEYHSLCNIPETPYAQFMNEIGPFGLNDMFLILGRIASRVLEKDIIDFAPELKKAAKNLEFVSKSRLEN